MKRAKLMLTGITMLAVVGLALAFKAKGTKVVYCQDSINNECTVAVPFVTTIPTPTLKGNCIAITTATTDKWAQTPTTLPCPLSPKQFYSTVD